MFFCLGYLHFWKIQTLGLILARNKILGCPHSTFPHLLYHFWNYWPRPTNFLWYQLFLINALIFLASCWVNKTNTIPFYSSENYSNFFYKYLAVRIRFLVGASRSGLCILTYRLLEKHNKVSMFTAGILLATTKGKQLERKNKINIQYVDCIATYSTNCAHLRPEQESKGFINPYFYITLVL